MTRKQAKSNREGKRARKAKKASRRKYLRTNWRMG